MFLSRFGGKIKFGEEYIKRSSLKNFTSFDLDNIKQDIKCAIFDINEFLKVIHLDGKEGEVDCEEIERIIKSLEKCMNYCDASQIVDELVLLPTKYEELYDIVYTSIKDVCLKIEKSKMQTKKVS